MPDIAQLRIEVFRDWPYLYDGDADYEARYLKVYLDSAESCVVGAYDGDLIVGAATATPLADHAEDFASAFAATDLPLQDYYYFAESVLLPAYRGQGAGHRFFDIREAIARQYGYHKTCFAAVIRPDDHPLRPRRSRALEPFWRKRGYEALSGVVARFSWKDVGAGSATSKPLQFWHRTL